MLRGKSEKLHCQHTRNAQLGGYLDAHLHGALRERCRQVRGWGKSLGADAVSLHRLGDRPGFDLAGGAAGDEHGQLASKGNFFLSHKRSTSGEKLFYQRLQLLR